MPATPGYNPPVMSDETARRRAAAALDERILAFIGANHRAADAVAEPAGFQRLALDLFEHQFAFNPVYREFCRRRGKSPASVTGWAEIPAVPTTAFQYADLAAFAVQRAVRVFHTSGTTRSRPGRHFLETTRLYDAALLRHFAAMMLADAARPRMLSLTADEREMPHSSLVHMIAELMRAYDPAGGRFYWRDGRERFDEFERDLRAAAAAGQSVCIFGTAFSFVHWIDTAPVPVALPAGSRVMETGGFKGRSRAVSRERLYSDISRLLGIPQTHIVAEYGMTELSSQYYDDVLLRAIGGSPLSSLGRGEGVRGMSSAGSESVSSVRIKLPPPWLRPLVVHPETLEPLPTGEIGVLVHFDLANRGSCIAVRTEDRGRIVGDGIELLGRDDAAQPRGCSLAFERTTTESRADAAGFPPGRMP